MKYQIKLYSEESLYQFLLNKKQAIKDRIYNETEDYILNVGEEQYIDHLKSEFTIEAPEIHPDKVYIDTFEAEIPGSQFPKGFSILDPNKKFKRDIIVYHVPFSGAIELLKYQPSSWTSSVGYQIHIDDKSKTIVLQYVNFYYKPEVIQNAYNDSISRILSCYDYLKKDLARYNKSLDGIIRTAIKRRKEEIIRKNNFMASLGVPIKQKKDTPQTFAIPQPKLREKITVKPVVHKKGFKPEPTLDTENYHRILKLIHDLGKNFERLPYTYVNKEEEHLRDHILMTLDPNFEYGSASGETFNKSGKTDIQLRYDSSAVFIAECKFWRGEKSYLKTIDQLLNYLTWRDSKTSIIIFVRNKDFSTVLEKVKIASRKHPNFIKELGNSDESWFNYIFSLPMDSNKELKLAVQLYHLPPNTSDGSPTPTTSTK